jgi:hypothetical protein
MNCPKCTCEQLPTSKFCSACGATLQRSDGSQSRFRVQKRELYILVVLFAAVIFFVGFGTMMRRATAHMDSRLLPSIGDVVVAKGPRFCSPSEEALDQVTRVAVKTRDDQESVLAAARTHSILLPDREWRVKIIDDTMFSRKVRLLSRVDGDTDRRVGRECWVTMEAVQ